LWFNMAQRAEVRRSALIIDKTGTAELTATTDFNQSPQVPVAGVDGATGYHYEPNEAVLRPGPVNEVMLSQCMDDDPGDAPAVRQLDEHISYFCSDAYLATPFPTAYRIVEVLPYKVNTLRQYLKEHNVTRLDIKKRGVDVAPEELRRTLMQGSNSKKATAGEHTTLVLTRIGDDRY